MKSPSSAALLIVLAMTCALPSLARTAEEQPPTQVAMPELATRLQLSSEQQAQIAPALEERNNQLKALQDGLGANASRREKFKAMREARSIQQAFVSKVSPVLTKEQLAEWEKLREETRARMKERLQERG